MSNQRIFDDIMNQFNSDDDDEEEENEESRNSEQGKKHKKSSSLTDNSNNQIKDKLFNTNEESQKKTKTQNRKKDEIGYLANDDNDENVEENNDDNENNEKSDSNENKESSVKDNIENNDNNEILSDKKEDNDLLIKSIHEEQEENDQLNNENENNENNLEDNQENNNEEEQENNNGEEQKNNEEEQENNDKENQDNEVQQNDDNNNENSEKNNDRENKEDDNIKNEEQKINEENKDKIIEENNLINELYDKNKSENIDHSEIELFRMGSFRPNPVPSSPKFSERISKSNKQIIDKEEKEINNNLTNFTETIETTIEGDKVQTKESINKYIIPKYTHNNTIISLGKIPTKELISSNNINNVELLDAKNKKIIEGSKNKSNEYEEKAEEEFLKREELKMQKSKEDNKEKQENKDNKEIIEEIKDIKNENNKKEDEDGKENVTEDEEDKKNNNKNSKKVNESLIQNEIKEDSKENIFSSVNTISNENNTNNESKSNNNNEINQIKVNVMSIKVLEQIQNSGNSQNSSAIHSHKNSDTIKTNNNNEKNINENKSNKNMGVNRNIYSKKIAPERNVNKNNKKIINQMPVIKNVLYESPSDKNMRKNNNNYSKDHSQNSSKNKEITPFNYINSNISKQMSSQKKNRIINANANKKINYQNNDTNEKNYKKNNNNINEEKFPFKPQIDKKSREISEKKLNNIKNNNINNNSQNPQNQTTSLGLLLLYEDADTKQKKLNQERVEQNKDIINKANSKKINNVSYNMVNDRFIKRIDNAIRKFGKKHQSNLLLNIVSMTQCLYELNIINELIKPKDNIQDINLNNQLDLSELQAMVESVKTKDIKKSEEIVLIEQLWFLLNPELKSKIDSNILCIFLKLFFCGNYSQKDLEKLIISLLEKYQINNLEKKEEYKSPLRDKKYNQNEIWPLAKFIKVFLNLKKDLKAYRENDYTKGDVYNNIIKEKDKDLTFEPNFVSNKYFYKYSQFQYNKDNSIIALINKYKNQNQKQKHDFNKVYERFKADKELHEKTLQKIREKQEENELKMCTNVPKINKYIPKSRNPSTDKKNKISDTDIKQPRYKLLYNLRKKFNKNDKNEIKTDLNDIVDENCTFKPQISDNKDLLNRTFSNLKIKKKPKGFNDYVNRNRSVLEKKELEKKLEEDKKYGRNYDKMQKMKTKIKPLNITDLNKSASKEKKNIQYISNTETKEKKRYQLETEKNENIIQNIYITLDIKTPSGTVNQLKIYNKPDKKTMEDVCNFCKIFSLNDDMMNMLIKKAIIFKYNFFGKNNDINKEEGFLTKEEFKSISNTYKKKK